MKERNSNQLKERLMSISDEKINKGIFSVFLLYAVVTPFKLLFCFSDDFFIYTSCTYLLHMLLYLYGLGWFIIVVLKKVYVQRAYKRWKEVFLRENIWKLFLVILWAWMFLCDLLAKDRHMAFFGKMHSNQGFMVMTFYFMFTAMGTLVVQEKHIKRFIQIFALSATIQSLFGVMGYCFYVQETVMKGVFSWDLHFKGVFEHFNHFGYFQCMVILCIMGLLCFCENKKMCILYALCLVIDVWILIMSGTFGGYLAACIASIIMFFVIWCYQGKIPKYFLMGIALFWGTTVAVSILTPQYSMFGEFTQLCTDTYDIIEETEDAYMAGTGRWELWTKAVYYISKSPIVGYGEEGLRSLYHAENFVQSKPANEYLEYAGFYGIPGAILYLAVLFSLLFFSLKNLKQLNRYQVIAGGAVFAYAISAFFGVTVFYTTIYFYIFIGLVGNIKLRVQENCLKIKEENKK